MAQAAMTVRLDSQMKSRFDSLCEQFGMSANTAINNFINAVVRNRTIHFSMAVPSIRENLREEAMKAIQSMQKQAEESGASEMTLDEINEEIRLAREERKQRLGL